MKKVFLALSLLLALPLQAQEYTSRYFHYNQWFDAPPPFQIAATTIDGTDTNAMLLTGGGAAGTTRGAYLALYGNENGGVGELLIGAGNVTGSQITLATGGVEHLSLPLSITAAATLTFGIAGDTSPSLIIRSKKADAADDGTLQLTAGGAFGTTRGAGIQLLGNDYGGAAAGGGVAIETGTAALNSYSITQAGYAKLGLAATTDADDVTVLLGAVSTTAPSIQIGPQTADGDDDATVTLMSGGSASHARGAYITLAASDVGGANSGGYINLRPGSGSTGYIQLQSAAGAGVNSVVRFTIPVDSDTDNADLVMGTATTTAPLFTIRGQTADGDDDGILRLTGGGGVGAGRGGYIEIKGEDAGGTDAGGQIYYHAGAGGSHQFTDYDTTLWLVGLNAPNTNDADLSFGKTNPTAPNFTIKANTANADDDATLRLTGGGAWATDLTRGAAIAIQGADVGGASAGNKITFYGSSHIFSSGEVVPAGVAVASLPAACTAGALIRATDSNDCNAGAGDGALCACNAAGNDWVLLLNY